MKILSLNCQRGYQPGLGIFLQGVFSAEEYDFILLQEFSAQVQAHVHGIGTYNLLKVFNDECGVPGELAIAHRPSATMLEHRFTSYASMRYDPVRGRKHPNVGLLQARFEHEGKTLLIGSLHLHSGMQQSVRIAEMQRVKKEIVEFVHQDDASIFGGDCNAGYPGEAGRLSRVLAPEFVQATRNIGGTLDSRYTEYHPHLPNRVAIALAKVGLGLKLKADQIFVDAKTAALHTPKCRILPDRISDHSPVELNLFSTSIAVSTPVSSGSL